MAKITRFEDLDCWKKARELVIEIYTMTQNTSVSNDFAFKDQIKRASISTMTNIAEGFSRFNNKDFIRFLNYSQSSASEVKSLLYIALDLNYVSNEEFEELKKLCDLCRYMTVGLLKHIKGNEVEEDNFDYQALSFEPNTLTP